MGIAHLGAASTASVLQEWEANRSVASVEQWEWAFQRLHGARRLNQFHADYPGDIARLHMWQALAFPADSVESRLHRVYAANFYREALGRRPTWGLAWSALAENRILYRGIDASARHAFIRGNRVAPWEPGVQSRTIWMGLAMWDVLPGDLRAEVTETVRRSVALDHQLPTTIRLATQYGWMDRLRPMLVTDFRRGVLTNTERSLGSR